MRAVLIDPHGDDGALFACWQLLRHQPLVFVPHLTVPTEEVDAAMAILNCEWTQDLPEGHIWDWDLVIGPASLMEGLPEHNEFAERWDADVRYLTYAGHPREKARSPYEVKPLSADWLRLKHLALACFVSQYDSPSWFHFQEDLREYVQ